MQLTALEENELLATWDKNGDGLMVSAAVCVGETVSGEPYIVTAKMSHGNRTVSW